ncbi:MAG TPA: M64 family metallopeptidase [Bacteroidales bacterium]|nr:M64 family metallopeptidase [Bacteroidales bacterium]HPS63441.1 M64 family metallopeptidase [Bacteroidales bacterium]
MRTFQNIIAGLIAAASVLPANSFAQVVIDPAPAPALKALADNAMPVSFKNYFEAKTLRVDYLLAGDSRNEEAFFLSMKEEPYWGGPTKNLKDPFGYGSYRYLAYDSATSLLLFSRGFNSLFQEWKGTDEAKKMKRAYAMTAVMPFPKNTIRFVIEKRQYETDMFVPIFERYINPTDYFISRESIVPYKVTKFVDSGDPADHVDIAFIAEGYTTLEMEKFLADAKRISNYFLSVAPYSEMKDRINFYAIESPSQEAGVTIPGKDIFVNTNVHSSFYTFNMDRYLTTSDTKSIYDIAANAPYDVMFVLVNSKRYGGGGFYNHYGQSTVDHELSNIVAIHEFGHQFAGLADEYYAAEVTYSDFYNLKFEPWEPNITTNVDFKSKWASLVNPGTPIPTPREEKFKAVTGMFEGGGYLSKGIYSPMMDCRMKSNEAPGFCPVCQEAIRKMILFYCNE